MFWKIHPWSWVDFQRPVRMCSSSVKISQLPHLELWVVSFPLLLYLFVSHFETWCNPFLLMTSCVCFFKKKKISALFSLMCKLRLCFVQYSPKAAFAKGALIDFLVYLSLKKWSICVCGGGGYCAQCACGGQWTIFGSWFSSFTVCMSQAWRHKHLYALSNLTGPGLLIFTSLLCLTYRCL